VKTHIAFTLQQMLSESATVLWVPCLSGCDYIKHYNSLSNSSDLHRASNESYMEMWLLKAST